MMNKYLVDWFDNKLWRHISFILIAESEKQVSDWVGENYEPRGGLNCINIQLRSGGIKLPIIVQE